MSNIDYVYDKDPKKYKNAKKIKKILWADFKKLVGTTWNPGANTPFDPIATQHASRLKMKVAVIGPRLKQLENLLNDKPFLGTLIY